jgi:hypothetical protein
MEIVVLDGCYALTTEIKVWTVCASIALADNRIHATSIACYALMNPGERFHLTDNHFLGRFAVAPVL